MTVNWNHRAKQTSYPYPRYVDEPDGDYWYETSDGYVTPVEMIDEYIAILTYATKPYEQWGYEEWQQELHDRQFSLEETVRRHRLRPCPEQVVIQEEWW